MPHLVQMLDKWGKDGLVMVMVNVHADEEVPKDKWMAEALSILKDKKLSAMNCYLNDREALDKIQVIGYPSIFVFDRQGRWTSFGGVGGASDGGEKKIERFIGELLKEKGE